MFGAVSRYLFYYLLGIRQTENSTGFQNIIIEPVLAEGLDFANGHVITKSGKISVAWQKQKNVVLFTVEIPSNTQAKFTYKGKELALETGTNSFSLDLSSCNISGGTTAS
jgi:alpha-L-rhamnosidase